MIKFNKNAAVIAAVTLFCCAAMAFFEICFSPDYFAKSAVKLALFLLCPIVWAAVCGRLGRLRKLLRVSRQGLLTALGLGVAVFLVILTGYLLLGRFFDLGGITESLTGNTGVGRDNFLIVALYISFVNSLLEEFFFRGFAYLTLRDALASGQDRLRPRRAASLFSAAAFSLYHVSMMIGWFGAPLFALILAALFVGGLIFNFINEKYDNIILSWTTHMFANFAINAIGLLLFNS